MLSGRIFPCLSARPHRLEAKDIALSRRKPGFESRWGHSVSPPFGRLFLCQKENREPCSHHRAGERLGQGVRLEGHPRPDHEWQSGEEDESKGAEEQESDGSSVSG